LFSRCSKDEYEADIISPKILIQSPKTIFNYSTDVGNSNVSYSVTLQAQGWDETKMSTLKLIVTDSNNNIVLEETSVNNSNTQTVLKISEGFETVVSGNYNAKFIAIDSSGNITSKSVNFTYND